MTPTAKIWHNGRLINWDDARIHVLSHVVNYGSSVFEGIRCYETASGPAIFRLREHMRRMLDSAKIYRIEDGRFTIEDLAEAALELVRVNGLRSCYIRPIVLRGYGQIGVDGTKAPIEFYMACWEWGKYLGEEALAQGVDVCISSWSRMAPNTLPALAKSAGNYLNSQLIRMEANVPGKCNRQAIVEMKLDHRETNAMRRLANCVLALVLATLLITTGARTQSEQRPGAAAAVDRTVLPPPDPPFRGKIEVAFKDSKAEFPEPLRAPKGAPNVLLIMGDDIGYGHMSAFGGPANTPTFDRLAKQGLTLHQLPHHGRLLGVACRLAHRAQRPFRRHGRRPGGRGRVPGIQRHHPAQRRNRVRDPAAERLRHRLDRQDPPHAAARNHAPRDRSTAGRAAWAPNTSTASSAPA